MTDAPPPQPRTAMQELRGIPVSGGSGVGRALLYEEAPDVRAAAARPPRDLEGEVRRLHEAAERAGADLGALHDSLAASRDAVAQIFFAHRAMLTDFLPRLEVAIRAGSSAEHAVQTVIHAAAAKIARVEDPILSQRAKDVIDIGRRLHRALTGAPAATLPDDDADGPVIVLASDLSPSQAVQLRGRNVAAIALEQGGHTGHAAVIIKSLEIPCVMGVQGLIEASSPGQMVWVDGSSGQVVIEPDAAAMERAVDLGLRYDRLEASLLGESHLPAETIDGHRATLLANIEYPFDVEVGIERGAEGVGLYRTEFLYAGAGQLPTEEQHVAAYREALGRLAGAHLTIRTFDFGADKESPLGTSDPEPNPALGVRSLRWCFEHPDAFRVQLRAILRVAAEGDVRVMLPMVASLEELRRARRLLAEAAEELAREGVAHRADLAVGVMIEIPAAAVTADLLAREADFFSIGTNDLIQYDLAVDRMNPRLEPLFRPSHPSVLRLIERTLEAAAEAGIPVTMCGEMGGQSIYAVLLMGMGLRQFSLTPGYIPRVRRLLRGLTLLEARQLAGECLRAATADEVEALLRARVTPVGAG
ncbi:MAG: phosphoenolpyruvate--protein phosphotransferase [Planctomycetota bacterium]|nr:phosphoenolpyruvate--protein phosphotransferase [Planctomycetota bacterium]